MFQKYGSNVLEAFIKCKMDSFVQALCQYLSNKDKLIFTVCNQFGNYVVQTLLIKYEGNRMIDVVIEVG